MRKHVLPLIAMLALTASYRSADARTPLKNICRVKGQEENVLRGLGMVVGLKGTGDSGDYLPTMRALARSMELMGNPLSIPDRRGRKKSGLAELKDTKNVALVMVEATVPAAGARRGSRVDCEVSAISAKSLAGGRLIFAALQGPNVQDPHVYATASGRIHLDDTNAPTVGRIHGGCLMQEDFFNVFQKDGMITLVLDASHADFEIAAEVANLVNERYQYQGQDGKQESPYIAKAIDPVNILVAIPDAYRNDPVQFIAELMGIEIYDPRTEARVVVNERTGSIVISGDVEIGSVVVSHKDVVVQTGDNLPAARFVPIDPNQPDSPKLKSLVEALGRLQVPAADVIDIIKGIERDGKLHGRLIVE